jgi:hypothetical protein
VPYKDLYNIYLEFYGNEEISELDIIECSSLLFAGRLVEIKSKNNLLII